jgi:hypothetical protein
VPVAEKGNPSARDPALSQRLPTDRRAPEREKGLVNVRPFVVTDAEAAELIQPSKGTLDDPPPPAQAAPVRGATLGQQRHDVTGPEAAPNGGRVVAAIPDHRVRPLPRSPAFAVERGDRIHQRQGFLRVVPIRAGQTNREWHAAPVANQMTLAAALGPIGGIRPGRSPPYTARMEQLSTTARDQSIRSSRASQSRSAKWIRSHTPAHCQSRRRRQHVMPDPHPSSCGSICHGMPLRRTKRMPVRHARSDTRGRPPCGRPGRIGKNGSTRSHNESGSNAAAIRRSRYFADPDQVSEVLLRPLKIRSGDELKVVVPQLGLDLVALERLSFAHRFVQPMDGQDRVGAQCER